MILLVRIQPQAHQFTFDLVFHSTHISHNLHPHVPQLGVSLSQPFEHSKGLEIDAVRLWLLDLRFAGARHSP